MFLKALDRPIRQQIPAPAIPLVAITPEWKQWRLKPSLRAFCAARNLPRAILGLCLPGIRPIRFYFTPAGHTASLTASCFAASVDTLVSASMVLNSQAIEALDLVEIARNGSIVKRPIPVAHRRV
jgi:hypothetical protein